MAYESSRDIMTVNVGFEVTEPRFSSGSTTLAIIAVLYKNNVSTVKLGKSDTRVALGDGATSTVFKTRFEEKDWEYHEALVAVKQKKRQGSYMTQDFSLDNWLRCCLNDLRIGSHPKLGSHPNIMEVLAICWEYYEHNDVRSCSPCLVLRLSELGPLSKFVRSVPYLPEASLIQHCADVLDGLKALHHYQVVHGDIKMENILLFKDHRGEVRAKISDFSHSIFLDDNFDGNTTYIGTRPFYVPEIRKQQAAMRTTGRADTVENLPACDIYASGILFWTLLTQGNDVANTIATLSPCHLIDRDVEDILEALGEDGLLQLCMRDLAEGILLPTTQIGRISQKALTVFRNVFHSSLADDTTVRGSAASLLNLFNSLLRVEDAVAVNSDSFGAVTDANKSMRIDCWSFQDYQILGVPWDLQVQIFTEMQRSASNDYTGRCNLLLATLYARGFGVQQDQRLIIDYLCKSAAFSTYARVLFWPIFRAMELDGFNGNLDDNRTIDIPQSTKIYERLQLMTYCERMRHVMYFRLILRLSPQSKHFFGRKFPYEIEVEDTGGFCYVRRLEDLEWLNIAPSAEGTPITFMCLGPLEREGPTAFLRLSMVAMDPRDINVINPRTTETPLITACRFGAEIEVIRLLHAGADPRIRDSCGFTPLHWLFRLSGPCQTLIAKLLIKNRADLNAVTTEEHILLEHGISLQFGCTPLHIAVIARSLETVQLLTALGADLEVAHKGRYPTTVLRFESYSLTPLHCAVSLRFPEIVKHLLDCGAVTDVAVKFPLYGAMTRNLLQILSIPFARGCETSPFARWILHGHDYKIDLKNTITTILSHNADIDKLGDDVRLEQSYPFASEGRIDVRWGAFLTNAAFVDDNTDVLETFLEQGIDLRRPSDCSEQEFVKGVLGYTLNGCTQGARKHPKLELVLGRTRCPSDIAFRILAHCAREDHVGAATSLLNHLNDLEIPPAVFHIAVEHDSADTLEALFRYSGTALIDQVTEKNTTLLAFAANQNSIRALLLLLRLGADKEINLPKQGTALAFAARAFRSRDAALILLRAGASVYCRSDLGPGFTVLHAAAEVADPAVEEDQQFCMVTLLINAFPAKLVNATVINSTTCRGSTALHYAAGAGNEKAVRFLIDHGADLNATDENGFTPFMVAQSSHYYYYDIYRSTPGQHSPVFDLLTQQSPGIRRVKQATGRISALLREHGCNLPDVDPATGGYVFLFIQALGFFLRGELELEDAFLRLDYPYFQAAGRTPRVVVGCDATRGTRYVIILDREGGEGSLFIPIPGES